MSRTRRILGGTTISYVHQAVVILVGLWLTPFLLHRVGQHEYGLWLVAGQLLGYLALLDLGVIAILPREVAFASGLPDAQAAARSDRESGRTGSPDRPLAVAGAGDRVCRRVVVPAGGVGKPATAAGSGVRRVHRALSAANCRGGAAGRSGSPVSCEEPVDRMGARERRHHRPGDRRGRAVRAGLGWTVTLAIPAVAAWWRVRKLWPGMSAPSHIRLRSDSTSTGRSGSAPGKLRRCCSPVPTCCLLGQILGAAAVVPYACTGKLVTVFANHPQLLMHAAQPALTELRASASKERLATVATALTQTMLMMSGALAVTILAVNHFFVEWWVGPAQYGGWSVDRRLHRDDVAAPLERRHRLHAVLLRLRAADLADQSDGRRRDCGGDGARRVEVGADRRANRVDHRRRRP